MQPNRKIGEKQDEMGRPVGKGGCRQISKQSRGGINYIKDVGKREGHS